MKMVRTLCAICGTDRWDRLLYPESLGDQAATAQRFSARRTPDRVHYRIVRCGHCGLWIFIMDFTQEPVWLSRCDSERRQCLGREVPKVESQQD